MRPIVTCPLMKTADAVFMPKTAKPFSYKKEQGLLCGTPGRGIPGGIFPGHPIFLDRSLFLQITLEPK
jgi:hypothetical protein